MGRYGLGSVWICFDAMCGGLRTNHQCPGKPRLDGAGQHHMKNEGGWNKYYCFQRVACIIHPLKWLKS